jgi:hypothetical protein
VPCVLQSATNVDTAYIDRAVKSMRVDDPTLIVLESGDVLTEGYLDASFESLVLSLQETVCAVCCVPCASCASCCGTAEWGVCSVCMCV